MTQNQRSYQAFLRAAKSEFGISHRQAQQMYKTVRDRIDRAPRAKDIKAHPRIAKQEAKRAAAPKEKPPAASKERKRSTPKEKPAEPPKPTKEQRKRAAEEFAEGEYEIYEDPLEAEY